MENGGGGGGGGPPLPKRPATVPLRPHPNDTAGERPVRSPPPRPTSKPPAPPNRPASLSHTGQNGTASECRVPQLPPPAHKPRGPAQTAGTASHSSSAAVRKRPEITIVSAQPMSQVGFREESAQEGLPAPVSPRGGKPSSDTPKLPPPPRPKSSPGVKPESPGNLIDFSGDVVTVQAPIPKPRPKPAARTSVHERREVTSPSEEQSASSSDSTLPSPMLPTRPTIIRSKPMSAGDHTPETGPRDAQPGPHDSSGSSGPKLPSYIHTTASNDASVNELKAAFQKRQSGMELPPPKPNPKPKPSVAQKPINAPKPSIQSDTADNGDIKTLTPSQSNEALKEDTEISPTPPSRRKRPTIIRPGATPVPSEDSKPEGSESDVQLLKEQPSLPVKPPFPKPLNEQPQSSASTPPSRPKPAARRITPPSKSPSTEELVSVTPPPRKRKTGPPRPAQRPLSGSLSGSNTPDSKKSETTPPKDHPSTVVTKSSVAKESPPGRPPSLPPPKPRHPISSPLQQDVEPAPGSCRRVIIHEVYPQTQAPKLPVRPGPGHPLFHYMMDCPYGIAVATNDYQSLQPDELSFLEGELIVLLRQVDGSWFYGKNGQIEGIFPSNHVKVVEPLSSKGVGGGNPGEPRVEGRHHTRDASPLLVDLEDRSKPDTGSGPRCRARFDYDGEGEEDLSFEEGDIIQLLRHVADDWFRGELNGQTGIFPAAFVEIIEDLPATPGYDASPGFGELQNSGPTRRALFDFAGQTGELSFKTGDPIEVLSVVNSDWLFGEANGNKGQFPSAFIDEVPSGLPQYVSPTVEQRVTEKFAQSPEEPRVPTPQSDASNDEAYCIAIHEYTGQSEGDLSFREADKITLLSWVNSDWLKGRLDTSGKVGIFPVDFVQIIHDLKKPRPKATEKVRVKALYDFVGEGEKELSFEEGEIISLLAPMTGEEWTEGELRGKTGIFPASFVEEISS